MLLRGLPGKKELDTECLFFEKVDQIKVILDQGKAATEADTNGSIVVYIDDEGFYRCEAWKHLKQLNGEKYTTLLEAEKWAEKWLKKIK